MKYGFISLFPKHNSTPILQIRFFSGRVGAYCIRPTKRPERGERVDDKRTSGLCFCALPGYPSDNRLDMEKRNTYSSPLVRDNRKHIPKETLSFSGNVRAYCIRPTKRPVKGERVDDKRARGVFNTPLPGYPSDNRLNMEKRNTDLSLIVRDNGKHLPEETLSFSGNVGVYCIRPTKRPAKGVEVDNKRARGVCFCAPTRVPI